VIKVKCLFGILLSILAVQLANASERPVQTLRTKGFSSRLRVDSQFKALGWSYHIIVKFDGKTPLELYNEVETALWNQLPKKNIQAELNGWNNWQANSTSNQTAGALAEIQLYIYPENEQGDADLRVFFKAHEGVMLLGEPVVFRKAMGFGIFSTLEFKAGSNPILKQQNWAFFNGEDAAEQVGRWYGEVDSSIQSKDKARFLDALKKQFSAEQVQQASELWETAQSIEMNGSVSLLSSGGVLRGMEPTDLYYMTGGF
jgi:hypothetical protein